MQSSLLLLLTAGALRENLHTRICKSANEVNKERFLWRYSSLTQTHSYSRESGYNIIIGCSANKSHFPSQATVGTKTIPQNLADSPSEQLVGGRCQEQHVLESASVPSWLPITGLFGPPLFPMTCCGLANLPEGRCLPCCSTAEPWELNPPVWVGRQTAINHSVAKESQTLNHKMWGHCVWNELTQLLWA